MNMKAEKEKGKRKRTAISSSKLQVSPLGATILVGRRGLLHLEGVDEG